MLQLSLGIFLLSWTALAPSANPLLGETFENERLHLRIRPPAGWRLVSAGANGDDPVEFWKEDEYGPRLQINAGPYPVTDPSDIDRVQRELARALQQKFPNLEVIGETKLSYQGHPAIEVTATLTVSDTFYHVIQRCLFAHGRLYIITCASFESSFLYDLPAFRAALDSFEVLDDVADLKSGGSHRDALVSNRTIGVVTLSLFALGLLLRRLSISRLTRMGLRH
jgi:hypothetical protein